jgi:hypothetical protein
MQASDAERQSVFVTVVAWIFIVLSGFAVFVSIGQNIMIWTHPGFSVPATTSGSGAGFEAFLDKNFRLLFLGFLGVTIVMLVSSVGLLKRKNWARVSVVALLALWVLWNIATLVMIYLFGMQDGQLAAGQPHSVFIQLFMLVFLVAVSALLIWIIRKLVSPTIVEEFTS